MHVATGPRATFSDMSESTKEDWAIIMDSARDFSPRGGERILAHMQLLDGDFGGFKVDRLTHSLQTATRAHQDGQGEDYVVMALIHDIGDTLGAFNHPDIAAAIIQPFVSEELHWIVQHHGIFQGNNFFHHIGLDRDMREKFRGHPSFEACEAFINKYDCPAFDPNYESAPMSFFEPMVMKLFERPKNSIYKRISEPA